MAMFSVRCRNVAVAIAVTSGLACVVLSGFGAAAAERPSDFAASGDLVRFSAKDKVILKSPSQVAIFDGEKGRIAILTPNGDRLKQRAEAAFKSVKHFQSYRSVRSGNPPRQGIEVHSDAAEVEFTLLLDDRGIFEFKPGRARQLIFRGLQLHCGLVPSLVGTDFLFDAKTAPGADRLCLPALNMFLGLVAGEDCVAVGVWPPGKQSAALALKPEGESRLIDGLSFDTAGQSFFFSCLEKPGIWHAEPLKRNYLEKDTVISWKRPFEAKWIGRFYISSDEYDWPFYFGSKPVKIWGRYIRGWYSYPLRFDGENTIVHFEKQFLPKGELLIYCLEPHPTRPDPSVITPAEVMARSLGKAQADKILDPEGAVEQTILDHRLAVCAMTNTIQKWIDAGEAGEHREQIVRWCDDTSAFIRVIRQRDQAFAAFARELRAAIAAMAANRPELAASATELQASLAAIDETSRRELPGEALETVQQWTDEMKKAAVHPESHKEYAKLSGQCRSVAGTQDDLARALSIQVIRLTEQAARLGVQSPHHARLAEEVIIKARQLLRKPTWWEPARRFAPKLDPGNTY
jgi:hypothetical protein